MLCVCVSVPLQEKLDQHAASNAKAKELLAYFPNYLITIIPGLHLCTLRLSEGINDPLMKLQDVYKKMTVMQGESMATAPTRLAGKNMPFATCIRFFCGCCLSFGIWLIKLFFHVWFSGLQGRC